MIARPACMLALVTTLAFSAMAGDSDAGNALMRQDFNSANATGLAKALLGKSEVELAKGAGPDGSDAIRVTYVGYDRGSKRVISRRKFSKPVQTATLSFDVQFTEDFQWVMGGKLHGMGPLRPITGGNQRKPGGWSARLMWGRDGKLSTYLYDQNPEKKWGVGVGSGRPVFKKGQWHHLDLQVHLNDPDQSNGFARVYLDGKKIIESPDMQFRARGGDDTLIQQFLFSTFHGGNKPRWAPKDDQGNYTEVHALYDNFVVREGLYRSPGQE